mgnify:FL=1
MAISRLPASLLLTGLLAACSWNASPQYSYTTPDANDTAVDEAVVKALGCEPTGMADAPTHPGVTEQEATAAYKAANEGTRLVLFANRGNRPKLYSESSRSAAYVDENAVATYLVFRGKTGVGTMSVYQQSDGTYYAVTTAVCP